MDNNQRVDQAIRSKTIGNKYFKESKYLEAKQQYETIIQLLDTSDTFEGEVKTRRDALLSAGYLNLAMAYLKVDDYSHALSQLSQRHHDG